MTWMMLLVGLAVGVLSGVVGIGGGIMFVPALIWLTGMSQHKAQGTSLGALLAPVGLLAFIEYYRKGNADIRWQRFLPSASSLADFSAQPARSTFQSCGSAAVFALTLVVVGGRMWFAS